MKIIKYIFTVTLLSVLFIGCTKKTDEIFDRSVDERLTDALTALQTKLTTGAGWKLFVYPKGLEGDQDIKVGGLTYYVKFTNANRVTMVSDFAPNKVPALAAAPKESGYRLKALQRPSLIFDTYSYMHIAADPDPNVSISPTGSGGYGYGTDFSFAFTDITPKDTMRLEGNFNNSEAVLVKATQAEMDAAFNNSRLRDIINFTSAYQTASPFLYFPAGSNLNVGIGFDFTHLMMTFSYVEAGNLVSKKIPSSYTTYGIHLGSPTSIGSYTFQDIYWDDAKKIYYIMSGATRVEFQNSATPVVTLPLTNIIGAGQYTTISVPPGAALPNMSPLFITRYNAAVGGMLSGPYGLKTDDMDFVFNAAMKTMQVNVYVFQGTAGYLAQYNYTYTVDGAGLYKFTKTTQNGNAGLVVGNMNNILSLIESDQFQITGYSTTYGFLGQLTSKQTPTFFFSGYLL